MVRIATMIPRYVDPQTTYSVASAPQARVLNGLAAADPAAVVGPPRARSVQERARPDQQEHEDDEGESHAPRMPAQVY